MNESDADDIDGLTEVTMDMGHARYSLCLLRS